MNVVERKKSNYIIACVSEFARTKQLKPSEAFQYLDQFSGITFLKEHYEIEHTLSFEDVIEDLTLICKKNGGDL
ncbi:MAG: DUF3791 domain-containing protein [Lachnospiraceae bacterium]|jgi:hypothetical protein|nr:DUF3791 domain-containing protein [Lachnospiraceae bacterium]